MVVFNQVNLVWWTNKSICAAGYDHSDVDPCVMRQTAGKNMYIILIYIDDLSTLANKIEAGRIRDFLVTEFNFITMDIGKFGHMWVWKLH